MIPVNDHATLVECVEPHNSTEIRMEGLKDIWSRLANSDHKNCSCGESVSAVWGGIDHLYEFSRATLQGCENPRKQRQNGNTVTVHKLCHERCHIEVGTDAHVGGHVCLYTEID